MLNIKKVFFGLGFNMSNILGIDQSYTSTGFCIIKPDQTILEFGTIKTTEKEHGDLYDRAMHITNLIADKIRQHNITDIRIEGLAFGIRGDATRDLAGLQFTIITHTRLLDRNIRQTVIAPTSLKKFATGTGKSDKSAMIESLPDHVRNAFIQAGFKKTTGLGDICDAYWLARYTT